MEGTIAQATHVTGIRHARYLGLPKTRLEHNTAAAAINLIRSTPGGPASRWTGPGPPTCSGWTSQHKTRKHDHQSANRVRNGPHGPFDPFELFL